MLARVRDRLQHDEIFCEQRLELGAVAVVGIDGGDQRALVLFQEPRQGREIEAPLLQGGRGGGEVSRPLLLKAGLEFVGDGEGRVHRFTLLDGS